MMSNVIAFLERMGQDARLRQGSPAEVEFALEGEQLDPVVRAAILAGDQSALNAALDREVLCCMLFPAEEEEGENEPDEDGDPSREGGESSARIALAAVA